MPEETIFIYVAREENTAMYVKANGYYYKLPIQSTRERRCFWTKRNSLRARRERCQTNVPTT